MHREVGAGFPQEVLRQLCESWGISGDDSRTADQLEAALSEDVDEAHANTRVPGNVSHGARRCDVGDQERVVPVGTEDLLGRDIGHYVLIHRGEPAKHGVIEVLPHSSCQERSGCPCWFRTGECLPITIHPSTSFIGDNLVATIVCDIRLREAAMRERDASVLAVGAGPTGLALALVLARMGVAIRIVDRKPGSSRESRALGVQAPTLELYRALGLSDRVVTEGLPMKSAELRVEGRPRATLPLGSMGQGVSAFPYLLIYPQDVHEPMLIAALAEAGVEVNWRTSLVGFTPDAEGVMATLERDGQPDVICADWLVGADVGRSTVHDRLFYLSNVQVTPGKPQYCRIFAVGP